MDIAVGTSGYNYPEWKGTFYPDPFPASKMFAFYAERFRTGYGNISAASVGAIQRNLLTLEQQGADVTGTYRTPYGQGSVTGRVSGKEVTLRGRYELTGTAEGGTIEGTARVGQEWPAAWKARREG